MCGIVGLHLREPALYPRLGRLLTGMLCQVVERGPDSAGVAVYGDPIWSPPGQGCVAVLEVDPTADDLGLDVTVAFHGRNPLERVLGEQVGALIAEIHSSHGARLLGGAQVVAFEGTERLEAVTVPDYLDLYVN